MVAFNAFQLVLLFACAPFIIGWLHGDPFPFSVAVKWVAGAAYLVLFVAHVFGMINLIESERKK